MARTDRVLDVGDDVERLDLDSDNDGFPQSEAPNSLKERRRAQKALFESWLVSDAAQEALKPKTKQQRLGETEDEELSIESLMAKQGTEIVKNPRQYQIELYERALKQNTIAVLDTGSGKTLIAVLLLRTIIDQELENRAAGKEPRISFFLVASVTLVYQQFAVLGTNIDHPVARVCGADNTDNWNKAKWTKLFSDNKVIVATADVLHQCLAHSYITMKQINLLVFDEAHHAKKNHAFARIIKDFYVDADEDSRPRIFGMTASPVDAKVDVVQVAGELESLLHCQIATTTDMSLSDAIKKPEEFVIVYSPLPLQGVETQLLKSIKARFGTPPLFQRLFETCVEIARHLGRWCADVYLAHVLSERRMPRYEQELDRKYWHGAKRSGQDVSQLDSKVAEVRQIIDYVENVQGEYSDITEGDLSSKVLELKEYLAANFERPSSHRCIVFVEMRDTARLLNVLFKKIGSQHMRSGYITGANNSELGQENFTFRQQVMTLTRFRKGEINCLFATSVAEEGLDVPDCNLVIRFDMYRTMIQYVQSRGRARQQNSKFVHMLESGSSIHSQLLNEVRFQETAMRRFCLALPKDRMLEGNEDQLEELMAKEKVMRVYTEPSTGAKLTYGNALAYLANFVSAIPTETEESVHPTYITSNQGSKFISEVLLPTNAPIHSAIGRICTKKTLAKRSAAFEACIELRRKKYLDAHLMPTYQKKLPALRNALLAVNMKHTTLYTMRTKPSCWAETRGSIPQTLYMTIVDFPDGLEHAHQPLALLTRTPMPSFPSFPVYLRDGRASTVASKKVSGTLQITEHELSRLSAFTFRVFKDVFSKTYEDDFRQLSYWLAPALSNNADLDSDAAAQIDWSLLEKVYYNQEYKWTPSTERSSLVGRFLVDKWDGGKKFYSIAINSELKPTDPVPDNVAKAKWNANILDYSISLFKNSRAKATWTPDQPVIEAEKILARRNMLATPDPKELKLNKRAVLCPEPLTISALTPAIATSCFVWPAVIHRFESYMIAVEGCALTGVDCEPAMALAAMTKDSDNSSEHETQERINFQRGMGENYERLEFIGDTFLKMATSISTFIQNPNENEFEFHVRRMLMLCNQNLFNVAKELKLYEYIRSIAFSRRLWYPEGLKLLEGKGANKVEETSVIKHSLAEKTIADVCEALIGAALLTYDKPGERWEPSQWDNAVRAVTKLVSSKDHTMMSWNDYITAYVKPTYQTAEVSAVQKDLAEKVELEHAYKFKYPRLLRSAFMHPSQPLMYEKVPTYQRLEFLGDALLDTACITYLFYRFPDKDPQWLTEHKMAMVSNKFLGAVCVSLGFHKHLRYTSSALLGPIDAYAHEVEEAKSVAGTARDYWTTVSDPPKCLPDIVEAYVGAMFIDSNFDYNEVQRFFDTHIKWYFEDMSIYDTFANNHPCTHLHNLLQTTYGCQDYRLMAKELPNIDATERKDVVAAVMIHDGIVAYSKGKSGRYARLRAAQKAIEVVQGLAPFEFRAKFGCDCHVKEKEEKQSSDEVLSADCAI